MSTTSTLLSSILSAASQRGLGQAQLATLACVRPETISRVKKRDNADVKTLQSLAKATGLELTLQPVSTNTLPLPSVQSPLAQPRLGLAWSNPNASAEALVCKAIQNGNYHLLLQAAVAHGLGFVHQQLDAVGPTLRPKARQDVVRKMANIEKGFSHAQA